MNESRHTIQKSLVLKAVLDLKNHPTAEDVYLRIAQDYSNISKATVYRNLNHLAESGDVLRIEMSNAPDRFDFRTDSHYHFKCSHCGQVSDVNLPFIPLNASKVQQDANFIIDGYDVIFKGKCKDCSAAFL